MLFLLLSTLFRSPTFGDGFLLNRAWSLLVEQRSCGGEDAVQGLEVKVVFECLA